jgi:hypothetical protein
MAVLKQKQDLRPVVKQFAISGEFEDARPHGTGHINDTYAAVFQQDSRPVRYILQRINHHVFKNPAGLMQNIERVTAHVRRKLEAVGAGQVDRRVLTLVPTRSGRGWHEDAAGNTWRCYLFIEGATTYDQIATTQQALEAAKAFGEFQKQLADLPVPRLHDTIPDFHHTRRRFDALRAAIEADSCNRANAVKQEIRFSLQREPMVDVLLKLRAQGALPERVTHNDTKLNNVMLDDTTGEGVCVIDLDTVMPGLALDDFGDMCRSACRPTLEDERDLSKVEARMDMFEALVPGYFASAGELLNTVEKDHLVFSARQITFEIGMRFLTDYLEGDRYFKTRRPGHNADRTRVQFKMVESFEQHEDDMNRVVKAARG